MSRDPRAVRAPSALRWTVAAGLLVCLACGPAAPAAPAPGTDDPGAAPPAPSSPASSTGQGGGPVLLELFTSQGCSSCPPADRLLGELAADPELAGRVFLLAFHVDYWNYIGWTDPFSSPRWSERQRDYARVLPDGRVYTPQLVIDGERHLVGSREGEVRRAVNRALARPVAGRVAVELGAETGGSLPVTVRARVPTWPGEVAPGEPLELWLALWQDGLTTPVPRGENAGRTLRDDRVVRRLVHLGDLAPGRAGLEVSHRLVLEPGWPRADLGVVAFLQAARDRTIHGVAGLPLGTSATPATGSADDRGGRSDAAHR